MLPQNIVSQYVAFIGLYWRRNHAAVFFSSPPFTTIALVLFHFDGDHGVTLFSIDRIVLGKIPCCHVAHLITFVTMVSLYNAH